MPSVPLKGRRKPVPDPKDSELVLCLQADQVYALFNARPSVTTWFPADDELIDDWFPDVTKAFLPRSIAEHDTSWLHVCTYSVLTSGDKVFAYRRGKSGSESRLHGALSIGVGGHVGLDDYDNIDGIGSDMLAMAALREIEEELFTGSQRGFGLDGLIADDSTPVNSVHLGAVYRMTVDRDRVKVREDCLAEPQWLTVAELIGRQSEMEVWSRIVLDELLTKEGVSL
jgi:predicted NUDIX family phosphoesterase